MVAALGLPVLGGVIAVLALLAVPAPALPRRAVGPATAGLCVLAGGVAVAVLVAGSRAQGLGGALAIDPLAAFFVLLPALAGLAACCAGPGALLPATVAAALLVLLAGDTATMALGVGAFALCGLGERSLTAVGVFLLAGALALLGGAGGSFAAIRAAPPDGWRAGLVLAATVVGVVFLLAGRRQPFAAAAPVALYLLVRVLLDLCGPVTLEGWGVPLLLAGGGLALAGAWRASRMATFDGVLSGVSWQHAGWMMAGLGVSAVARAADLLPLATLGAGGAMLHALSYTVAASLAALSAGAAERAAGSRSLDRLGGLARGMPVAAAAMLLAGLSLALLPPSAGFASGWMLLQALFAAPRIGALPMQVLLAGTTLALACSLGLGGLALVRVGGLAFLGRPRTPRAAAAEEAGQPVRWGMLGLMAACVALGLFPGAALSLAGPAQALVSTAGMDGQGGWAGLRVQPDAPGYQPLVLALLVGLGMVVVALLVRTGRLRGWQRVAAWEGGFAAPPAWMPFGDPATQVGSNALTPASPPRAALAGLLPTVRLRLEMRMPGHRPGYGVAALLAALVALLLVASLSAPA